jgi:hypothetical protein
MALLLIIQGLAQRNQLLEQLLNIAAALVVGLDQFLELRRSCLSDRDVIPTRKPGAACNAWISSVCFSAAASSHILKFRRVRTPATQPERRQEMAPD